MTPDAARGGASPKRPPRRALARHNVGRPSKLTPAVTERLLHALRTGNARVVACRYARIIYAGDTQPFGAMLCQVTIGGEVWQVRDTGLAERVRPGDLHESDPAHERPGHAIRRVTWDVGRGPWDVTPAT